jgi:hypothetical protein
MTETDRESDRGALICFASQSHLDHFGFVQE